jgi:hypothetical protein
MAKNAKLTPAMERLVEALNRHGYVDLIRDGRKYVGTVCGLMDRGILREQDRRGRHYPATDRDAVHAEALVEQLQRSGYSQAIVGIAVNVLGVAPTGVDMDAIHAEALAEDMDRLNARAQAEQRERYRDVDHADALVENEAWEARQADEQEADLVEQDEALNPTSTPVPLACSASVVHLPHAWISTMNGNVDCPGLTSDEWRINRRGGPVAVALAEVVDLRRAIHDLPFASHRQALRGHVNRIEAALRRELQ